MRDILSLGKSHTVKALSGRTLSSVLFELKGEMYQWPIEVTVDLYPQEEIIFFSEKNGARALSNRVPGAFSSLPVKAIERDTSLFTETITLDVGLNDAASFLLHADKEAIFRTELTESDAGYIMLYAKGQESASCTVS